MSNRSALRKLAKKVPPPEKLEGVLLALYKDSERAAAIVGASILEARLEKLLVQAFRSEEKTLPGKLFENRGPLSDFNSKILCCQAFGILPDLMCEELQSVRHIRNVFAHARVPVTFRTKEIAKEVQSLRMLMALKTAQASHPEGLQLAKKMTNKRAFLLMVNLLLIILDGVARGEGILHWTPALIGRSK